MREAVFEKTSTDSYWQFLRMINWTEPWLIALGGFHTICLLIIILSRGHSNIQLIIFLSLLAGVYCAEYINQFAAEHWQSFAEDQYFDSQGLFLSTVFCLPMIINCCVLVIFWLYESISLLKLCIKRLKRARSREEENRAKKNKDD